MSYRMIVNSVALLVTLAATVNSQPAGFGGPISGVVYAGASRSVRPLLGAPGSAFAGPALIADVEWASIAPGGRWGLVSKAGRSRLIDLVDIELSEVVADDLPTDGIDRVAWSRDGSVALLYASSGGKMLRVRISGNRLLTDSPFSAPAGPVATVAVDAGGRQVAVGVAGPEAAGLYLVRAGQAPVFLSPMAQPTAAAFDETGDRLYVADLDTQRILEFDGADGPIEVASLQQPEGLAMNPAGLAVSAGGRYLLLADRANRAVRVYETSSRSLVTAIPLDFAPTRLDLLCKGPIFLLNGDVPSEWLMLLDARQDPVISFVPAVEEELR